MIIKLDGLRSHATPYYTFWDILKYNFKGEVRFSKHFGYPARIKDIQAEIAWYKAKGWHLPECLKLDEEALNDEE